MPKGSKLERRAVTFDRPDASGTVSGTVVPYGVPSRIADLFDEVFEPGSLSIRGNILLNVQHDRARPLARAGHGLTLTNNATQLRISFDPPATTEGRDVAELIRTGVLTGFSMEFRANRETFDMATKRRTIHEAELRGIAIVDDPAHTGALIDEIRQQMADAEQLDIACAIMARRVWT